MNTLILLTSFVLVFSEMNGILCFTETISDTELDGSRPVRTLLHMAGRKISDMWSTFRSNYITKDSFLGKYYL